MKAVLFDLDGVITDTAEYHYQAWKALADRLGIQIDRAFNEELKGVSRKDSLNKILAYGHQADRFTEEEKEALMKEKNDLYLTLIDQITPDQILPGIMDLLTSLKKANIKIALASASKNGPFILEKLGIRSYFDGIANPADVAQGKPAPDLYIEAARTVGVEVVDCVGVEDAASGIAAILAASMVAIGVGDINTLGRAQKVVRSTADLTLEVIEKTWSEYHA